MTNCQYFGKLLEESYPPNKSENVLVIFKWPRAHGFALLLNALCCQQAGSWALYP